MTAADRAGHRLGRAAGRAERPAGSADSDGAAAAAAGAGLQVGRVGDQAGRAQRPSALVAGGGLADGPAPRARLGPGPGHAAAAAPHPADPPVEPDGPVTALAGRGRDLPCSGGPEFVDEPEHARHRRPRTVPGQQPGVVLDGPGQLPQLGWPGEHPAGRRGDLFRGQSGVCHGGHRGENHERIPVVAAGAPAAARLALPVKRGDDPLPAAGGAQPLPQPADRAIPVLAAALQGAQVPAASGAGRRGDHRGAGDAQRDQQVPGDPGRRRAAIGKDLRPLGERLGKLAPLGPAAGDAEHCRLDHRPSQARLDAADQGDGHANRVGQHVRDAVSHRPR